MALGTEVDLGPGHIVLDGNSVPPCERGTAAPPLFGPCLLRPRSPISATAELLYKLDRMRYWNSDDDRIAALQNNEKDLIYIAGEHTEQQ